jgi:hypothetical protein
MFPSTVQNDTLTHTKVSIGDLLEHVYYLRHTGRVSQYHRGFPMKPIRAQRKYRQLGNLIQICTHLQCGLDIDKVARYQRKVDLSNPWNNRKKKK